MNLCFSVIFAACSFTSEFVQNIFLLIIQSHFLVILLHQKASFLIDKYKSMFFNQLSAVLILRPDHFLLPTNTKYIKQVLSKLRRRNQ